MGPFAGYAVVDHPDGVSPDLPLRTTTNNAGGQSDHVMFTFTALAGSPPNVRVGVVTDGLDGARFSPTSIGLAQVSGDSVEHTLTSVNNTPDMVFFDLIDVRPGDQFQIFGDSGSGGFATHQIVTWDALPLTDPDSLSDPTSEDGDSLGDNWENFYFGNLSTADDTTNSDPDGLTDLEEWNSLLNEGLLLNPRSGDTDQDSLSDDAEIDTHQTDPTQPDSDGDGLLDGFEVNGQLDPNDPNGEDGASGDPDQDDLTNLEEQALRTVPRDDDSDDDGYGDGVETGTGFWSGVTATGTDPLSPDSDGDGILDGAENPDLDFDPANPETQPGSDPNLWDSDFDGTSDGNELISGTDPTNFGSIPSGSPRVLSVDFQGIPGVFPSSPILMAGGSPLSNYLSANWNALDITGHDGTDLDPTWTGLVNAQGTPTNVAFTVTGRISSWTNPSSDRAIFDDYLFVNAGNADPSMTWQITGLAPNSNYKFFPYGGFARDFAMTVDRNGDGDLSDETPTLVPAQSGVEFTVTSSGTGTIQGSMSAGNSGEANWSGFELLGSLPGVSGAEVAILSIDYDGEDVFLTWSSSPGAIYTIESSGDLQSWTILFTDLNAAASPATTTTQLVDTPSEATRFYRVISQ